MAEQRVETRGGDDDSVETRRELEVPVEVFPGIVEVAFPIMIGAGDGGE